MSIAYKIPSYLISDLEIKLILVPMYGVPEVIFRDTKKYKDGAGWRSKQPWQKYGGPGRLFSFSRKFGKWRHPLDKIGDTIYEESFFTGKTAGHS